MKLELGKLVLADTTETMHVSGWSLTGDVLIQEVQYLRGKEIKTFNRGNKRTSLGFTTSRLHENRKIAQTFLANHDDAVFELAATNPLVTFTAQSEDGKKTLYIKGGKVKSCQTTIQGATTFTSYQIVGGRVTTVKPTP